jgi:hypothetical protein
VSPLDLFLQELKNMSSKLEYSQLEGSLKQQIKAIFNAAKAHVENLSGLQTEYAEVVESYLEAKPPFEWNRNQRTMPVQDLEQDPKFNQDIEQYQTLIEYSLFANDIRYCILKKWGIDYPFSLQGPGLAQPNSEYIDVLAHIRDNNASETQKPYYNYIIENLR